MKSLAIDACCSATRRVPMTSPQPVCCAPRMKPERGDIVVGTLTALGHHDRLEVAADREVPLSTGMICTLVLARRYSTLEFHGELPQKLIPGAGFHLLSAGGTAGRVVDRNGLTKGPTCLEFMGYATARSGEKLSLNDHCVKAKAGGPLPVVILVVGADMEVGKTTAASCAIRLLSASGHKTAGVKLTGTSRMKDLVAMENAGGDPTFDFVDFGLPSTYGASLDRLSAMFHDMRRACGTEGCRYIVVEVADGLFQPETRQILARRDIMDRVSVIIFASADSVGVYGGCRLLSRIGHAPHFLSGLFTASNLKMDEVKSWCPIPILSSASERQEHFVNFVQQFSICS